MCISFADLFSSLITVGGFSNVTNSEIKQNEFSVYAISLYETETKIQAKQINVPTTAIKHHISIFICQPKFSEIIAIFNFSM